MVTFLSVFLGLVLGAHPVTVSLQGEAVAVELRLDGQSVGILRGEPWSLTCDFGSELAPHELVAVAFDVDGKEIDRASQWINLPQPRSQAELSIEPSSGGRRARLTWHSADGAVPDAVEIRFDGAPLQVEDPRSFPLPTYDPQSIHLLKARLVFGRSHAQAELPLGGSIDETVATELTAFVVRARGRDLPEAGQMSAWLTKHGEPLEVVSIEHGGADIIMVQEATPKLWGRLRRLERESLQLRNALTSRATSGLQKSDRLRVMLPIVETADGSDVEQFHISWDFSTLEDGPTSSGVGRRFVAGPTAKGLLATLPYPPQGPLTENAPRQVADAVAIAAQAASAGRRARAVVLVKGSATADVSRHAPEQVRRYAERLQVPIVIWSPDRPLERDPWGTVGNISTARRLVAASLDLRRILDEQRVLWVRGRHLPHEIQLSATALEYVEPMATSSGEPEQDPFRPWSPPSEVESKLASEEMKPLQKTPSSRGGKLAGDSESQPIKPAPAPDPGSMELASPKAATARRDSEITPPKPMVVDTVDVRLVQVEVMVTDRQGRPLRGLEKEDFELFEDGRRVEIRHFSGLDDIVGVAGPDLEKPSQETPSLVVFFDSQGLDAAGRRDLAQGLRRSLLGIGSGPSPTRLAVTTMLAVDDGSLKIPLPFTRDPALLGQALNGLEAGRFGDTSPFSDRSRLAEELSGVAGELEAALTAVDKARAEALRDAFLAQLDSSSRAQTARLQSKLDTLSRLATSLGGVEGRKLLLYAGNALEVTPMRELYEEAELSLSLSSMDLARLRASSRETGLRSRFDELLASCQAAGATFYAVAPAPAAVRDVASRSRAGKAGFQGRLSGARQEQIKEAICQLSGETGGLCQAGSSGPSRLVDLALRDLDSAYVLGFSPDRLPDGAVHSLEVKLDHSELSVRHREAYSDRTPRDQVEGRLAAALFFNSADNPLGMEIRVEPPASGGSPAEPASRTVVLDIRIPVERLGLQPLEGGQSFGADSRLLIATRHEAGGITEAQEYPIRFQVPSARLGSQPPLLYSHKVHLLLAPGSTRVAVGLWDEISRAGSFESLEVTAE